MGGGGSKGCTSQLDPGCSAVALPAVSSERGPLLGRHAVGVICTGGRSESGNKLCYSKEELLCNIENCVLIQTNCQ